MLHLPSLRVPTVQQKRQNVRGESEMSGWGTAGILQLEGSQQPQADPAPHRTELLPHPLPPPLTQVDSLSLTSQVRERLQGVISCFSLSHSKHILTETGHWHGARTEGQHAAPSWRPSERVVLRPDGATRHFPHVHITGIRQILLIQAFSRAIINPITKVASRYLNDLFWCLLTD